MKIITSHASIINGKIHEVPVINLIELLKYKKMDFIYIRHSMNGEFKSKLFYYSKGMLKKEKTIFTIRKFAPLRYITEIISTFFAICKNKSIVYIGVDPLNAFTGIMLKKINRTNKVIFYTADYSDVRFKNKILDWFYHSIDRYCVKNANEVWNVSTRIKRIRKNMGLHRSKNIYLPNVPSLEYKKYIHNKKNKYHLVTLGILSDQLDFSRLFKAINELKALYPQIKLKIIGDGPKRKYLERYVLKLGIEKYIKFYGYLNHNDALKEISTSGIGIALYNGKWNFNYYGDSLKCREFFSLGLPVITTDTHSTVEEIQKYHAGIVCKLNKEEYKEAIKTILNKYEEFRSATYKIHKKNLNVKEKIEQCLQKRN